MKNTHKLYTDVIAKSGSKNEPLEVTSNGTYEAPKGIGYSPVKVNVPQVAQGSSLKAVLDARESASYLFYQYEGTSVDGLISYSDTDNVTNMAFMFHSCYNLMDIPRLDTSKVTNMEQMLFGCLNLTSIPLFNTSNVTKMSNMFNGCSNLTTIPQLDTSKVKNMFRMFYNCSNLTTIPQLDTSNVTTIGYMFSHCTNLTTIPALDVSKCINFDNIFWDCTSLASIGMYGFTCSIDISETALEHDAIVAFLNQAGTAYDSSQKITMGSAKLALLSDEEKAIATNKGWTLA